MNMDYILLLSGSYKNLVNNNNSNSNNNNYNNISTLIEKAYEYIKIMSKKCTWGGHIEIKALEKYIHMLGYKGIQVLRKTDNGKFRSIKSMGTRRLRKYPKLIKLVLNGVDQGGLHFRPVIEKESQSASVIS